MVTGQLSEGSFVRKVVVQVPKFDTKPNPKPNPNPRPNSNANRNLALTLTQTLALTLCLYFSDKWPFGQVNCYHAIPITIAGWSCVQDCILYRLYNHVLWLSESTCLWANVVHVHICSRWWVTVHAKGGRFKHTIWTHSVTVFDFFWVTGLLKCSVLFL